MLPGKLRVQVHYYEDGNVQLQSEKDVEFAGSASVSEDLAIAIANVEAQERRGGGAAR